MSGEITMIKVNKVKRLQILHKDEVSALFDVPQFNLAEKNHFFELPKTILDGLKINRTNSKNVSSKLYFILQYGYFKARHQFFNVNYKEVKSDVLFVMKNYMPKDCMPSQLPTRKIQRSAKDKILELMGFGDNSDQIDELVSNKAGELAKTTQNLSEIFDELVKHLEDKKTVLPPYSRLQDLIGAALKSEEERIIQMVNSHLGKGIRKAIDNLFQHDGSFYQITAIKFDAKSFQKNQMEEEIRKLTLCKPIYEFAKKFLPKLMLSRRMIDHYSDLAKLYTIHRLSSLPNELSQMYLMCYVNSRCEQLNNNLIQAFMYYVDKYHADGAKFAEKNIIKMKSPLEEARVSIGQLLAIFTNKKTMRLEGRKIAKQAFKVMREEEIDAISKQLLKNDEDFRKKQEQKLIWEYHRNNYQSLLINLRPLFLAIDFEGDPKLKELFKAVDFLKSLMRSGKTLKDVPFDSIPLSHIKPKSLIDLFT